MFTTQSIKHQKMEPPTGMSEFPTMINELGALLDALNLYVSTNFVNATPILLQYHPSRRTEMIQHEKDRIHRMHEQITRVGTIALKFKAFEQNMNRRHSALQNTLSPVFSLPTEILLNILSRVVFASRCRVPPERLLLVCSAWKSLILSSPELWAGFTMYLGASKRCHAYFERSKPRKIQVILLSGSNSPPHWVRKIPPWIASEDFASRVTRLCVQLDNDLTQSLWAPLITRNSPLFTKLSILKITGDSNNERFPLPLIQFLSDRRFPRLTKLHLSGVTLTSTPLEQIMNIRFLVLEGAFMDNVTLVALMRCCPQLHTLHMRYGYYSGFVRPDMSMTPIHLPHLREIHVTFSKIFIMVQLFTRIRAPEIRTLRITSAPFRDTSASLGVAEGISALDAFLSGIVHQSFNELEFRGQIHTMTLFLSLLLTKTQPRGSSAFLGLRRLVLRTPVAGLGDNGYGNEASQLRTLVERLHERGGRLETLEATSNFITDDSVTLEQYVGVVRIIADKRD
ncbi:uncharacterized protein EI90DRAFT_3043797 [Cantharellus anzutake]|uniref:uncharacterized protein n=1 Tax=Cantharellus anzutake TaxID=1750568 RepID=UPI0019039F30|nr:uncharacterized protein EI90DRAFT_3043797 [Cantharellus anzutake]KAF8336839.1 hypothetical protein EI90DRAFT_3043797 [Cantharellus anzutake]